MIRTKTELKVFNKLVRDLCLIGVTTELGERQLLVRGTRRLESGIVIVNSCDNEKPDSRSHVKVESRPPSRTMGPPTMIVVWNPKSRSIFAHRFVNELLNFEKFLMNKVLSTMGNVGL